MKRIIPFGHSLLQETITKDDVSIDATIGNGNDTVLLAQISKHVIGFDIQKMAIEKTESLLKEKNITNVSLYQVGHENIDQYVDEPVKAIVYNLGYLPGGDKNIISTSKTTLVSIEKGLTLLVSGGIIVITIYVGHDGGLDEARMIETFTEKLPSKEFSVLKYQFINKVQSPYVIVIKKNKGNR